MGREDEKFTQLEQKDKKSNILKSIEGYLIMISNVHQECQEDDIIDCFTEFGQIKNLHLNLDRRTGYVKGYCLLEYGDINEAQKAIKTMNGKQFMEQTIQVNFAFKKHK